MVDTVYIEKEGNVGRLVLNRPDNMNTFNEQMSEELPYCVSDLSSDSKIRLVIVEGNGPVFMAGGDVNMLAANLSNMPGNVMSMATALHRAIETICTMKKPVVAKVHGAVAGAGLSLMLAADLVLASDETVFNLAYTHLGTSPDGGASFALPRMVSQKLAMQLMLLSERFSADEALHMGLINWSVPKNTLNEKCDTLTQTLANGPTLAYAKIKTLVHQSLHNSLNQQLQLEAEYFTESTTTKDFAKGLTSFVNKTKANFSGT